MQSPIIIVGGGIAGLACASLLLQQNQPVVLFEASDRVGGRVRTDIVEGYRIDGGFQVVPEAYPALAEVIALPEVGPRRFAAGAIIWDGTARHLLESPLQAPKRLPGVLRSGALPLADKLRLAKLAASCRMAKWPTAAAASVTREGSQSASAMFQERGFSETFITRFAKPLWGGIPLDPNLSSSAGPLLFTLKMFAEGAAILPNDGMQALPAAIAHGRIANHYQPIVSFAPDGRLAFESLARLRPPQHGALPPDRSIPPAERPGLGGFLATLDAYDEYASANLGKHKVPTLRNVGLGSCESLEYDDPTAPKPSKCVTKAYMLSLIHISEPTRPY